jgi:hypothetical protein
MASVGRREIMFEVNTSSWASLSRLWAAFNRIQLLAGAPLRAGVNAVGDLCIIKLTLPASLSSGLVPLHHRRNEKMIHRDPKYLVEA